MSWKVLSPLLLQCFCLWKKRHILDPGCETDMCALHYVFFFTRVQRLLDRFAERFNMHSISTEHNRTPRELWASGCLRNFHLPNACIHDVLDSSLPPNLDMFGDDWKPLYLNQRMTGVEWRYLQFRFPWNKTLMLCLMTVIMESIFICKCENFYSVSLRRTSCSHVVINMNLSKFLFHVLLMCL